MLTFVAVVLALREPRCNPVSHAATVWVTLQAWSQHIPTLRSPSKRRVQDGNDDTLGDAT